MLPHRPDSGTPCGHLSLGCVAFGVRGEELARCRRPDPSHTSLSGPQQAQSQGAAHTETSKQTVKSAALHYHYRNVSMSVGIFVHFLDMSHSEKKKNSLH